MGLSEISADDLRNRYPVFKNEDAGLIDALLDEARGSVNDTWIEADRKPALLALAAHLLFVERYGNGLVDVGGSYQAVTGPLEGIDVGDTKIKFAHQFASDAKASDAAGYSATPYGKRYLELFRRSFPAVMVV